MNPYARYSDPVIAREAMRREREMEKLESTKQEIKSQIANLLRDDNARRATALEAKRATDSGYVDPMLRNPNAGHGTFRGYFDNEVITGNEEKVWERD
jgi:hypothetical protein